jgi:ribosomal 30S subunit maturation factor RimM
MKISDLIHIGKLSSRISKMTDSRELILKVDKEYSHLSEKLDNVFLLFTDHRVRYTKIDIEISEAGQKKAKHWVVCIEDEDIMEELITQKSVTVCLDDELLNMIDEQSEYFDPIGMSVIWDSEEVATIVGFFFNGAHDVYEIKMMDSRVVLIPDVSDFVTETNVTDRYIKVVKLDQFF